jgi:hypothetical protein
MSEKVNVPSAPAVTVLVTPEASLRVTVAPLIGAPTAAVPDKGWVKPPPPPPLPPHPNRARAIARAVTRLNSAVTIENVFKLLGHEVLTQKRHHNPWIMREFVIITIALIIKLLKQWVTFYEDSQIWTICNYLVLR